jgi:hypothetical protein
MQSNALSYCGNMSPAMPQLTGRPQNGLKAHMYTPALWPVLVPLQLLHQLLDLSAVPLLETGGKPAPTTWRPQQLNRCSEPNPMWKLHMRCHVPNSGMLPRECGATLSGEFEPYTTYLQPGCEGAHVAPQALHFRRQDGLPHAQLLVLHLRSA